MTLEKSTADPAELKQAVSWRHDFHAHPELAFKERRTAAIVEAELRRFGLDVETGIDVTGVVGTLKGRQGSGPAIGLRSELDALPLNEINDIEYRSRTPGHMHACGHDGHAAILLETACRLAAKPDFRGAVYFIVQPTEEHGGGAKVMLDDGLLDRYPCESIWVLHNWPDLLLEQIGVRAGAMSASADTFDILIKGRGGHAGLPHQTIDPIAAGAQFATGLWGQLARRVDAVAGGLCSITRFEAGSAYNVVPNAAKLAGTVRTLHKSTRALIEEIIAMSPRLIDTSSSRKRSLTLRPSI